MVNGKAGLLTGVVVAATLTSPTWADSGRHPGYLQALADLRAARSLLTQQTSDPKVDENEKAAISEVDAAINEIKKASIDDGKPLSDHANVDVVEVGSRLLRSLEILHKAQDDIRGEVDSAAVKGLRTAANNHIGLAIQHANGAHDEWMKDNKK